MINSRGPKVFSKEHLIEINYPISKNPKPYYLSIEIENVKDSDFGAARLNFKNLEKNMKIQNSETNIYTKVGLPLAVNLTKLMRVKVK